MTKPDYYIGIDPDVHASGLAIWQTSVKQFTELSCEDLFDLCLTLQSMHNEHSIMVRLEAGWLLTKSNFSNRNVTGSRGANERIAKNVGANHEIGKQIEKYCIKNDIPYELVKPLGYSAYNHATFCAYTKWPTTTRTNSESRVAGMLVYGY